MEPIQIRMARAALQIGVRELAKLAGIAPATVMRFEKERGGLNTATLIKLKNALQNEGVVFGDTPEMVTVGLARDALERVRARTLLTKQPD